MCSTCFYINLWTHSICFYTHFVWYGVFVVGRRWRLINCKRLYALCIIIIIINWFSGKRVQFVALFAWASFMAFVYIRSMYKKKKSCALERLRILNRREKVCALECEVRYSKMSQNHNFSSVCIREGGGRERAIVKACIWYRDSEVGELSG